MSDKDNSLINQVKPYQDQGPGKKEQVRDMFDNIAGKYDLLNHTLTLGIDVLWRRKAIKKLSVVKPRRVLDIATGTADFALEAVKLNPEEIIGIDISSEMIEVGKQKVKKEGYDRLIKLRLGDSEAIDMEENSVDAITVGFGVRNFENLELGLTEIRRVLRPGGAVAILEPSYPDKFPLKQLFYIYFRWITPLIGRLISGDDSAYTYLPESVKAFPNGKDFVNICLKVGFKEATYHPLTFGSCALYVLTK